MPHLTTHVLDTSRGVPAAGITIELHVLVDGERVLLATATTNADGRTSAPLMPMEGLPGVYELTFHAGDYFRRSGIPLSDPPFLDDVIIRFGLGTGHHHVPLLLSPFGYSTYKGS